jgi:23S rRNA pseudouridine1911/1915/1917 synthase
VKTTLEIIYHSKGILVVNKPHGLPSQPTPKEEENVYSLLGKRFDYVGLHHRLDRPASGLLLLSTNKKWNKEIATSFAQRTIQRSYVIWVLGKPPKEGTWNQNLDGKTSISIYKRIYTDGSQSVLLVQIQTGRKHQIRRHATMAGYPILGDKRYGKTAGLLWDRLSLHAFKLLFVHPATTSTVTVLSPIPKDLIGILGENITNEIIHSLM